MAKEKESPIIDASFIIDNPKRTISISPALDIGLSGKIGASIQEGTWILLSGPPKCGKSTTALQIAANAQQQLGKIVYIGNVEGRIKKRDLEGISNLDISKVKIVQSSKGNILSGEKFLSEFMTILKENSDCVLIVDSTSVLCSQDEMDGEITANRRPAGPKLLASFCRQMAPVVPTQNNIVILIQHIIANTGTGMSPTYEDGGNKIQFQGDTKLRCTHFKKQGTEDAASYGQEVNWVIHTSALGSPGAKIKSFIRYGHGVDHEAELVSLGSDCGLIAKAGSWYSFPWIDDSPKMQGEEKVRQFLKENESIKIKLIEEINRMV